MKKITLMLLSTLSLASLSFAGGSESFETSQTGFYLGVNAGPSLSERPSFNGYNALICAFCASLTPDVSPYTNFLNNYANYQAWGPGLGIQVGYRFHSPLRAEVETTWFQHSISTKSIIPAPYNRREAINFLTLMGNIFYDFSWKDHWAPYLGLGLGFGNSWGRLQELDIPVPPLRLDVNFNNDQQFVYQGILGLDYAFNRHWRAGLNYHIIGIPNTLDPTKNRININFENRFNLGLLYFF